MPGANFWLESDDEDELPCARTAPPRREIDSSESFRGDADSSIAAIASAQISSKRDQLERKNEETNRMSIQEVKESVASMAESVQNSYPSWIEGDPTSVPGTTLSSELDRGREQRVSTSIHDANHEHIMHMRARDVVITFVALITVFMLVTILGSLGPERLATTVINKNVLPWAVHDMGLNGTKDNPVWSSSIMFHYDAPQFFFLEMTVRNEKSAKISVQLTANIKVAFFEHHNSTTDSNTRTVDLHEKVLDLNCDAGPNRPCPSTRIVYVPEVDYRKYTIYVQIVNPPADWDFVDHVRFVYTFRNHQYMSYELGWRCCLFTLTAMVFVGYMYKYCKAALKRPTIEQIWLKYLLVLLMLLDAPWAGPKSLSLVLFTAACQAGFIAAMLMFWLISMDLITKGGDYIPGVQSFYLAKAVYIWLGFITMTSYYFFITWHQYEDVTYEAVKALGDTYSFLKFGLLVYILVYLVWFTVYFYRALKEMVNLNIRMKAVFGFTVLIMAIMFTCLLVRWNVGVEDHTSGLFVAFTCLCNLYIWGMAFFCYPVRHEGPSARGLSSTDTNEQGYVMEAL